MRIAEILKNKGNDVLQVSPDATVLSVVAMLAEKRIGCVPVVENGEVIGIFSERDVVYQLAQSGHAMLESIVRDVMTTPPVTITSDMPIVSALSLITRRRIRHLPVVDGGEMVGFVSIGDLVKFRIDNIEAEATAMRDYIQSV
ncbi:histidine kinase [Sphingobium sp. SCG-1]|uniref:CBS domain-containing protein n=1 Tax=Sphingobium sp. SCG-1 TaxID=2072936 RepID=UPI000CD6B992|nr:CBS domain-containing protein [Sphingobium sp. SCG-1]AUW59716.1 histidine kinase [Sphingobium sp. SCG-1]